MAGRRLTNLACRNGTYYFRGFVPRRVNLSARVREVRVSLRTKDMSLARLRVRAASLAFEEMCRQLNRMIELQSPDEDIRAAVRTFAQQLFKQSSPPPTFSGATVDYDRARTRFWVQEEISTLEYAVENHDFSVYPSDIDSPLRQTRAWADNVARQEMANTALPEERLALLKSGIARAQLEERRHHLRRLDDPFAPLTFADPLFAPASPAPPKSNNPPTPSFDKAVDAYIGAKSGVVWTARTEEENRRILRLATEHFGANAPIDAITLENVRAFRDSVIAWRKKPVPTATLKDISNAPSGARIGAKTAAKYFQYLSAAFAYWTNEGFIEKSPVGKLTIQIPHQSKSTGRVPFSTADLTALYSSPIFTGCAGLLRRTTAGPHVYRDGLYWALLIAPLSGMRITEIVQLATGDINFEDEVPSFVIKADASLGQTVKSDAGWRRVPVHRRLIELGFKDYVTARLTDGPASRLFPDIHVSGTGGAGGEFSKLYGRLLKRLGLKKNGLVFHSYRHTFVDALRELDAPEYIIKRIVGHASGSVTDGYGAGASLKACQAWINKITIMDALPPSQC